MKEKLWILVITAAIAASILKDYLVRSEEDSIGKQKKSNQECSVLGEMIEEERREQSLEEGKIQSQELAGERKQKEESADTPEIRVLIKNNDFQGVFHDTVSVSCAETFQVKSKATIRIFGPNEKYHYTEMEPVEIIPMDSAGLCLCGLSRAQTDPVYEGRLELSRKEEGILVINRLPLEDYLSAVLSSEMSSDFPLEALKAQAVCARTYAEKKMQENENSYYGADLDDSVSYQVYNNVKPGQKMRQAVEETRGVILTETYLESKQLERQQPAEIYYYSTSCGIRKEDIFETEEEFGAFIASVRETDLENEESWYRWTAQITMRKVGKNLRQMGYEYTEDPYDVRIIKRSIHGQAQELEILFPDGKTEILLGEYAIRCALAPEEGTLFLQDGSSCENLGILPSGWFVISQDQEIEGESEVCTEKTDALEPLRILGGGYGHGTGMAQNGAKCLAEQGMNYKEILKIYYPELHLAD